jgi:peptidoglycan DL-endopeptidase CwlO
MSTRLRSLVPALALTSIAFALASALPLGPGMGETGEAAVAIVAHPEPHPHPAPVPSLGERAATIALRAVGVPYRWGGESPRSGFDCSGLVRWTYLRLGIELPHSSYALYGSGTRVARARMKPGDVLFFSGLGHVGLYLGDGRMVHAPETGKVVEVVTLAGSHYGSGLIGARRVASA